MKRNIMEAEEKEHAVYPPSRLQFRGGGGKEAWRQTAWRASKTERQVVRESPLAAAEEDFSYK